MTRHSDELTAENIRRAGDALEEVLLRGEAVATTSTTVHALREASREPDTEKRLDRMAAAVRAGVRDAKRRQAELEAMLDREEVQAARMAPMTEEARQELERIRGELARRIRQRAEELVARSGREVAKATKARRPRRHRIDI